MSDEVERRKKQADGDLRAMEDWARSGFVSTGEVDVLQTKYDPVEEEHDDALD